MTLTLGGSASWLWTFQSPLMSRHQSHRKCRLGDSGSPTSTIRQACYGISPSADPATPLIRLDETFGQASHLQGFEIARELEIAAAAFHIGRTFPIDRPAASAAVEHLI